MDWSLADSLRTELAAMLRQNLPWCYMCLSFVDSVVFLPDYGTFVCPGCSRWFGKPRARLSPQELWEALEESRCLNCWDITEEYVVLEEIHTGDHVVCCPACAAAACIVEESD